MNRFDLRLKIKIQRKYKKKVGTMQIVRGICEFDNCVFDECVLDCIIDGWTVSSNKDIQIKLNKALERMD
jgi:hypothetical protein